MDTLFKIARAGKSKSNAVRNLLTVLTSNNFLTPVPIDAEKITITKKKPETRTVQVWWPILKMSDWTSTLLRECPGALLCGFEVEEHKQWGAIFQTFWERFYQSQPEHELFMCSQPKPWDRCVPYYVHGDEGRGLRNRPLMVEAFQVAIGAKGVNFTNEAGSLGL